MTKKSEYRKIRDKYSKLDSENKYLGIYHFSEYFDISFRNTCDELRELKELESSSDNGLLYGSEEEHADAMERIAFLEYWSERMASTYENNLKEEENTDKEEDTVSEEENYITTEEDALTEEEENQPTFASIKKSYMDRYHEIQEASRSGLMAHFEVIKMLYTEKSKELEELKELRLSLGTDRFVPEDEYNLIYKRIAELKSDVNFFARQISNEICKLSL